eukprot:TRINITY_DN11047_c0_g1_i1.p1 TRINITY_DN11047_c0_g1~~TRINITY_DN11047_c0_g1_i1.p1  ORF type:complete len:606 (+),score=57.35 TRINITY_DN11047_c0_g1_i1:102-1919(+)
MRTEGTQRVWITVLLLLNSVEGLDNVFGRPVFKEKGKERNVTNEAMVGVWKRQPDGADRAALNARLDKGFNSFGYTSQPESPEHNTTTRTLNYVLESNDPGVAEMTLTAMPNETSLIKGHLTLRTATYHRRYVARGYLNEDSSLLFIYAVPIGLQHLIGNPYIRKNQTTRSFLAASYSIEKFTRNVSMWAKTQDGEMYSMPSDDSVKQRSVLREKVWEGTHQELERDSCVWMGGLRVERSDQFASPLTLTQKIASYALQGSLVSLTCNSTIILEVSHDSFAAEADSATMYLLGGLVVTVAHAFGMYRQALYARTQSTLARLSWVTFLNIGVLEWSLAGVHWSMMDRMPVLLRPVLGICFFHAAIFHLCARHAYNALEASTSFGRSRMKIWVLPILSFPVNLLWWATENRIPVLWIPCLFVIHSIWLPQIYQTASCKATKPINMSLLVTTFVSRLYFVGNELLRPTFFSPYNAQPWLYVALVLWLGFQTVVVALQRLLGPTFFVPEWWLTEAYNYHRPLPAHLKQIQSISTPTSTPPEGTRKRSVTVSEETGATLDCVICQSLIDVNSSTNYMLPPCEHLFHPECLIEWMQHKMECPVCRRPLPEN